VAPRGLPPLGPSDPGGREEALSAPQKSLAGVMRPFSWSRKPSRTDRGLALRRARLYLPGMLPRGYLAQNLTRPLPTKDGGTLRTIGEAAAYIRALPKERELRERWQTAADFILKQAPASEVTSRVNLALFYDAEFDVAARRGR
jgi:hypothetical protein